MNVGLKSIVLAPVIAAQAVTVIARTPRLPEPAGARAGTLGSGPGLKLLIVGDSSAAGVGAAHQSEALSGQLTQALSAHVTLDWQLVAKTGITTQKITEYLQAKSRGRFDAAVTALGVNDITRLVPPAKWVAQTLAFHDLLRRDFGVTRIYVTAIPPIAEFPALPNPLAQLLARHASALQTALQAALSGQGSTHLVEPEWGADPGMMAMDGFHPGPQIYARWGSFMAKHIVRDLSSCAP